MQTRRELGPCQVPHDCGDPAVDGLHEVQDPQPGVGCRLVHSRITSLTGALGTAVGIAHHYRAHTTTRSAPVAASPGANEPGARLVTTAPQSRAGSNNAGAMTS
ncbi:hypothetical protein GCM10010503_11030 [Streptomyces lucensis JCM 4490]|uniref:Uncharacterized protein n=1 Tax=Streptomyces lucensis JCM 4490 TaxID=1306176 RepID=A0A918IYI1_9ACTN|nr:hypothetical protein GCM10010503_11030 [Streptomyces lucensis JCM 4490]